jgi:hypothetical protein
MGLRDEVNAQILEIVERADDAWDVAEAIAIGVFVAGGPNLVADCVLPPVRLTGRFLEMCHLE